ncbi:hypothetical protein HMPREF0043_01404 [Actinobaculum sp. oral taxon 183 str. F0552]|jgi:hypothetical protein|nr:hypothetical protein HMPREF0043_01404 [Actinobaculum sp. oral taxon 183 str. F0552]
MPGMNISTAKSAVFEAAGAPVAVAALAVGAPVAFCAGARPVVPVRAVADEGLAGVAGEGVPEAVPSAAGGVGVAGGVWACATPERAVSPRRDIAIARVLASRLAAPRRAVFRDPSGRGRFVVRDMVMPGLRG